jgi:hypothetical protein
MNPAWLGVIIPVAIAMGTAMSQYLIHRRTESGQIGTSQADALWAQTQAMIASLQRDKERAEDQRDKLIDLQERQLTPALEALTQSQQHVLGLLREMAGHSGKS